MRPKFSVLMSVYDKEHPKYLSLSLKSITEQTTVPDEIVLIEDGLISKELKKVIEEYENLYPNIFKRVALDKNQGLGKALQIGIMHCNFNIIARMDSDDIARSDRFEKQLAMLADNLEFDVVGSFIDEFDGAITNVLATRRVPISSSEIYAGAKRRNPFNHMTVMFRKQAVLLAGNYQPFLWNEDYFLWVRMIQKQAKMANIPESLVYARTGKQMFERRGGIKYIINEIKLQNEFLRIGFINIFDFALNILIRTIFRLLPNSMRGYLYIKLLR